MTWILLLIVITGNGTTPEEYGPFGSEQECKAAITQAVKGRDSVAAKGCMEVVRATSKEFD